MIGELNIGGRESVEGVNGDIETYTVYTGDSISAGDFVELITSGGSTLAKSITTSTQTISGVANTSGSSGATIEIYVPEVIS